MLYPRVVCLEPGELSSNPSTRFAPHHESETIVGTPYFRASPRSYAQRRRIIGRCGAQVRKNINRRSDNGTILSSVGLCKASLALLLPEPSLQAARIAERALLILLLFFPTFSWIQGVWGSRVPRQEFRSLCQPLSSMQIRDCCEAASLSNLIALLFARNPTPVSTSVCSSLSRFLCFALEAVCLCYELVLRFSGHQQNLNVNPTHAIISTCKSAVLKVPEGTWYRVPVSICPPKFLNLSSLLCVRTACTGHSRLFVARACVYPLSVLLL